MQFVRFNFNTQICKHKQQSSYIVPFVDFPLWGIHSLQISLHLHLQIKMAHKSLKNEENGRKRRYSPFSALFRQKGKSGEIRAILRRSQPCINRLISMNKAQK